MRKPTPIQTPQIRFKRWSRKSYSIFCSLKRTVNIGVLSKNIADTSCRRSDAYALVQLKALSDTPNDKEHEDALFPANERFKTLQIALVPADSFSQKKDTVEFLLFCRKQVL